MPFTQAFIVGSYCTSRRHFFVLSDFSPPKSCFFPRKQQNAFQFDFSVPSRKATVLALQSQQDSKAVAAEDSLGLPSNKATPSSLSLESNRIQREKQRPKGRKGTETDAQNDKDDHTSQTFASNLKLAELARTCARTRKASTAMEALELLHGMEYPDTVAFNSVLNAFAKISPQILLIDKKRTTAAAQAQELFIEMKDLHLRQRQANQDWYDALSENHLNNDQVSQGPPRVWVKPNVRSYSTVMDAYARLGTREAAERVEALLHELEQAYSDSSSRSSNGNNNNEESLRPTLITYNTVLAAWSRVPGAHDKCLTLLQSQMPVSPDVISYNSCLHALAQSDLPNAGEQAEALLRSMPQNSAMKTKVDDDETTNKATVVYPNSRSYTTCMHAWNHSRRPEKAIALFEEMRQLYEETQDPHLQPNCVSYATVIHAYALSHDPDKAAKAHDLFEEMTTQHSSNRIEPNRVIYNNLLNCYATSTAHNPQHMKQVKELYQQILDRDLRPDQFTFGTVLKACRNLSVLSKDRAFAPAVFAEACQRGQVSSGVLWQFRNAVPMEIYRSMVGGDGCTVQDLPKEWSRNVRNYRRRR